MITKINVRMRFYLSTCDQHPSFMEEGKEKTWRKAGYWLALYGFLGFRLIPGMLRSCTLCRHYWEVDSCSITPPFWANPEKYWWSVIYTVGRTSGSTHVHTFLGGKGKCPDVWLFTDSWPGANGLAGWPETGKEHDWKRLEKCLGKKYVDRSLQMGEGCEDPPAPYICSSKGDCSWGGVQ